MKHNTSTIRVLHCITDKSIGGAGVLLTYLLQNSRHPRIRYAVALPHDSALVPRLQGHCTLFLLPLSERSASLSNLPHFISAILRYKPHVLHTHGAFSARLAGLLTPPFPFVLFSKHCLLAPPLPRMQALTAHAAVATAHAARRQLVREGYPARRILTVPNAVPTPALPPNVPSRKLLVGFCGRLEPEKNPAFLLRVAARLRHDDRFRFLYIGDGSLLCKLRRLAHTLQVDKSVNFLGAVNDTAPLLAPLFALVNASLVSETRSLSMGEALALGIPVLAAPVGGNGELIIHGQNGLLYPADDADACAAALVRLADDPALQSKLRRGAQRRAQAYTARHMAARYEALYTHLHPSFTEIRP